jgi:rubrerythrin
MSDLLACRNCATPLSRAARGCPKCGTKTLLAEQEEARRNHENLAYCRTCGKPITKDHRRVVVTGSYIHQGNTAYGRQVVHTPCPHCGEPMPIKNIFTDGKAVGSWILLGVGLLFLLAMCVSITR